VSDSERPEGPRHRADGPPDAGPEGVLLSGAVNQDVLPAPRWTVRRRGDRRQAEGNPFLGAEGERRGPSSGRRRAEDYTGPYAESGDAWTDFPAS